MRILGTLARMLKNKLNILISVFLLLFFICNSNKAESATFMDSDTYCLNYGCLLTCDSLSCDVYDVYIFPGGPTVPVGGQLIPYTGNPIVGGPGLVNVVYRNTVTNILTTLVTNTGTNISVINPLGGPNPLNPTDAGTIGYLDAADTLVKFGVQAGSRVDWRATPAAGATAGGTNTQKHNFYLCSRNVAVDVRASAVAVGNSGQLPISVTPTLIGYLSGYTLTGTDAGTLYGTNTNVPGANYINAGVNSLGLLIPGPTTVASFTLATGIRGTAVGGASNVTNQLRQCIRFEADYQLPTLDFSQGDGTINYRINYDFFKR